MAATQANGHSRKFKDLTGQRFASLTVTSLDHKKIRPNKKGTKLFWKCLCDCGKETVAESSNIANGTTKSCGCLKRESYSTTHGETGKRLHTIWICMKGRCYNTSNRAYSDYGGRGIVVCDEWRTSYEDFRDWATANGYDDSLTLDRHPDTNGNYEPGNCRWANWFQQQRNRRDTIMLEFRGQRKSLCDWADEFGIRRGLIYERMARGWDVGRAITTPVKSPANAAQ
jgi:hypothetical protein